MAKDKQTIGQAIDLIIQAMEALEPTNRETVLNAVCSHLNIAHEQSHVPTSAIPQLPPPPTSKVAKLTASSRSQTDIRTLKEQKQPSSARQMACVVAYYLQEVAPSNERKKTISAEDLEKYFKQAKFKLPKTIQQVLVDAKASGYFESVARGEYRLNAVGYNLVAHNLPKSKDD